MLHLKVRCSHHHHCTPILARISLWTECLHQLSITAMSLNPMASVRHIITVAWPAQLLVLRTCYQSPT